MKIQYASTYWGSEQFEPNVFVENIVKDGYDGVELFLQPDDGLSEKFMKAIESVRKEKPDFFFILLQLSFPATSTAENHIAAMEKNLQFLAGLNPLFINSHTGTDFFSFDDNCRIIESAMEFSLKNGVKILHETHRGRFSFHAATLLPYLNRFPEMELVGDFSHFCNVSESMLEDQQSIIEQIISHVTHIHARVGYEQGPQVNDPSAPEWQQHLDIFLRWWNQIIEHRKKSGSELLTITPEFGPAPYMPQQPFSKLPLSDQWADNLFMKNKLKETY